MSARLTPRVRMAATSCAAAEDTTKLRQGELSGLVWARNLILKYFSESRSGVSVSSTGVATLSVKLVQRQSSSLFVNNYQVNNKEYLLVQHHLLFGLGNIS